MMTINASLSGYIQPLGSLREKVIVPVVPSQALYSNLENVQGIPDKGGVSLDKLQMIDGLISFYNNFKSPAQSPIKPETLDMSQPDKTFSQVASQVHEIAKNPSPFQSTSPAGILLNVQA